MYLGTETWGLMHKLLERLMTLIFKAAWLPIHLFPQSLNYLDYLGMKQWIDGTDPQKSYQSH